MANYVGTARTNYFRVKDRTAFEAWIDTVCYQDLSIMVKDAADPLLVGLNATNGDCSGFSINYEDEDGEERNLLEGLAQHLAEGEVAVLVEAGSERARYVTGFAIAVMADAAEDGGYKSLEVSINDIYGLVESRWGAKPTEASH
jgi:hypothetical protein